MDETHDKETKPRRDAPCRCVPFILLCGIGIASGGRGDVPDRNADNVARTRANTGNTTYVSGATGTADFAKKFRDHSARR